MKQVLDLHIHSPYSRACSPQLTLTNIDKTCREKGIDIIATGDFTYPAWFKAISEELEETFAGSGLYKLKTAVDNKLKFILSTEVALIYKDETRVRRIHLVIHAPNIEAATKLNERLGAKYNIKSDGRPILGIKAPELVRLLLEIDEHFLIYPAHIWTPWFAVFGSKSGFDTLEECFKEETKNIYAYETGLSSDPEMNWRLSALDNLTLLSSSDAHSPINIGREATVMELETPISYSQIYEVIKNHKKGGSSGILYTIEFYPEEGMYHIDGHRDCGFSCLPAESQKLNNLCPICQKPLIIGVLNRVAELADRPIGFKPETAAPFKKVIELDKIIAEALNIKSRASKQVRAEYQRLVNKFGSELFILLDCDLEKLKSNTDWRIIEGIERMRSGHLEIKPGFDGQYGDIHIFSEDHKSGEPDKLSL
ncbi:MAG: endonuclease Q family protein [Patescibacteria group bacterium]|jgi:uncharacterized protein (TIGR00375 family)